MSNIIPDLWPDIDIKGVSTRNPYSILKEQASKIAEKTSGIVQARVFRLEWAAAKERMASTGLISYQDEFAYSFDLLAPALNDYSYQLFVCSFSLDFYPCHIEPHHDIMPYSKRVEAKNEEEFISAVREIFSAPKTQKAIEAIIAQSRS